MSIEESFRSTGFRSPINASSIQSLSTDWRLLADISQCTFYYATIKHCFLTTKVNSIYSYGVFHLSVNIKAFIQARHRAK
jgi:hypothetical protein